MLQTGNINVGYTSVKIFQIACFHRCCKMQILVCQLVKNIGNNSDIHLFITEHWTEKVPSTSTGNDVYLGGACLRFRLQHEPSWKISLNFLKSWMPEWYLKFSLLYFPLHSSQFITFLNPIFCSLGLWSQLLIMLLNERKYATKHLDNAVKRI
jgi:hypothetical protein